MENQNSGQFMANAGGQGGALAAAMARRQGALTQQSPASPGGGGVLPVSAPTSAPQMASGASSGVTGSNFERVDDAHIILKAMAGRLKSQEKIAEANAIPPKIGV